MNTRNIFIRFNPSYCLFVFILFASCKSGGVSENSQEKFRLINAAPKASAIDFELGNNEVIIEEIAYGDSSGFIEAPEGTDVAIKIKSDLRVLPVLENILDIASNSITTSFFIGEVNAYELVTITEEFPTNTNGKVSFRVANMSPTEASVDIYLVVIGTDIEDTQPIATEVASGSVGDFVQFDPGFYAIVYTRAGTTTVVREVAGFNFVANRGYTHVLLDKFQGGTPLTSRIITDF